MLLDVFVDSTIRECVREPREPKGRPGERCKGKRARGDSGVTLKSHGGISFLAKPATSDQKNVLGVSIEDSMILFLAPRGKDTP